MNSKKILWMVTVIAAVTGLALNFNPLPLEKTSEKSHPSLASSVPRSPHMLSNSFLVPNQNSSQKPIVSTESLTYNTRSFKGASLPERLIAMSVRRQGRAFDPEQVAKALQSDVAWEFDPSIADALPITLSNEERKDGREFVRVNPMKIEALMPGDEISLPITKIKSDGALRMVVDRVEEGGGGNLTWHGHLKDFGTDNQVSLTRGDSLIVGGVSSPNKNYVIQIYGDRGWIVDGSTIFKGRADGIDPTHPGDTSSSKNVHPQ